MKYSKRQEIIYALITVFITVHAFIFYCLSLEKGGFSFEIVKKAYSINTWVFPIPLVVLEFVLAMIIELLIGSRFSKYIAFKVMDPNIDRPYMIELMIIISTVCIMCPIMSFIATILYYLIPGLMFNIVPISTLFIEFIPKFLQTFVINFPFALLGQLFFIQPLVRKIFKVIYK